MILSILAIIAGLGLAPIHANNFTKAPAPAVASKDGVIKRGAPLGSSPVVTIADILSDPGSYSGRTVTVNGLIRQCCTRKGCWMELSATKKGKTMRVTFKDYGFFVPTTSKGMKARAEGTVVVKTLSKEDVEHMVSEGANITPNADGTATEIGFVATGVELRRK